jgi:signal transduction histidine kinase
MQDSSLPAPQHDASLQGAAHNNPVANDAVMSSPAAIPAVRDEASADTSDGTKRPGEVLVVDDMGTVRLMLTRHIVQMGHRVTPAKDGREALELLRSQPFDLVLLDIEMPEMNGHEVLEAMKSDVRLREIPVVMISGIDDLESVVRCIERGAEDYLPKPFNPTLLRARVSACLEKKRLWDELADNYRQLQQLEKMRDSLTHMIVHDLRTPLTSIISGMETLEFLPHMETEYREEIVTMARRGGERLLGMINDLLDISKLEDGSMKLEKQSTPVPQLVDAAVEQVTYLLEDKQLRLEKTVDPILPPLPVDSDKIQRVLVNLLGNAIKFTPQHGTVCTTVRSAPDGLCFSIIDTGEGIPREAFARIFEKFGQVETRQSGRKMSTGLGLTFCKMAVEAHGGRIWVESEPGQGSTFSFVLPSET